MTKTIPPVGGTDYSRLSCDHINHRDKGIINGGCHDEDHVTKTIPPAHRPAELFILTYFGKSKSV